MAEKFLNTKCFDNHQIITWAGVINVLNNVDVVISDELKIQEHNSIDYRFSYLVKRFAEHLSQTLPNTKLNECVRLSKEPKISTIPIVSYSWTVDQLPHPTNDNIVERYAQVKTYIYSKSDVLDN